MWRVYVREEATVLLLLFQMFSTASSPARIDTERCYSLWWTNVGGREVKWSGSRGGVGRWWIGVGHGLNPKGDSKRILCYVGEFLNTYELNMATCFRFRHHSRHDDVIKTAKERKNCTTLVYQTARQPYHLGVQCTVFCLPNHNHQRRFQLSSNRKFSLWHQLGIVN